MGKRENAMPHKEKGKTRRDKREKGKDSNSTWQPDRAHARTKRNDFPVRVTPQPPMNLFIYIYLSLFIDLSLYEQYKLKLWLKFVQV